MRLLGTCREQECSKRRSRPRGWNVRLVACWSAVGVAALGIMSAEQEKKTNGNEQQASYVTECLGKCKLEFRKLAAVSPRTMDEGINPWASTGESRRCFATSALRNSVRSA